jgi:hypothetical protein
MSNRLMLYVPTRGRVDRQLTVGNLPKEWQNRCTIVCPASEIKEHSRNHRHLLNVLKQPDPDMSIAQKRAWLLRTTKHEKIMMLDDDLRFCHRHHAPSQFAGYGPHSIARWKAYCAKHPGIWQLDTLEPNDPRNGQMFQKIELMLDVYRHGGIGPRQMNQALPGEWNVNFRAMYALAYHVPTVLDNCVLGRIEHREDFDYTLQLFLAGFENAIYTWGALDQVYNTTGGASLERSMKASNADAVRLAKMFYGVVKVKEKTYLRSIPRKEVVVSWKVAAERGQVPFLQERANGTRQHEKNSFL